MRIGPAPGGRNRESVKAGERVPSRPPGLRALQGGRRGRSGEGCSGGGGRRAPPAVRARRLVPRFRRPPGLVLVTPLAASPWRRPLSPPRDGGGEPDLPVLTLCSCYVSVRARPAPGAPARRSASGRTGLWDWPFVSQEWPPGFPPALSGMWM